MNCFVCTLAGNARATVGVCTHCGAALCAEHFREAQTHAVGGMRFGCPHAQNRQPTSGKGSDAKSTIRP